MKRTRARLYSLEQILAFGPFTGCEGESNTGGTGGAGSSGDGTGGAGSQGAGGNSGQTGGAGSSTDDTDDDTDDPENLRKKLANRTEQAKRQDAELRRLKEVEKERDELARKQEEAARKDATELENAQRDLEKATTLTTTLRETVRALTIENTFLKLEGIDWHDPGDALRLVDLSDVEFDEKGTPKDPKKLADAAKKLAKDKPHLVKGKTAVSSSVPTGVPSGSPPANGGPPVVTDEAKLRAKYKIKM
jgi:hypothetical protein